MTAVPTSPAASQQAAVDAALLVLKYMGLSLEDLTASPGQRPAVPTFAAYVPLVSATVSDGTRKAYGSYWDRVTEQWGTRRLDEPTPSEIKQLVAYVRANVVPRRNARSGRSAAENLIAALRYPTPVSGDRARPSRVSAIAWLPLCDELGLRRMTFDFGIGLRVLVTDFDQIHGMVAELRCNLIETGLRPSTFSVNRRGRLSYLTRRKLPHGS